MWTYYIKAGVCAIGDARSAIVDVLRKTKGGFVHSQTTLHNVKRVSFTWIAHYHTHKDNVRMRSLCVSCMSRARAPEDTHTDTHTREHTCP